MGPEWAWDAEPDAGPASGVSWSGKQPLMPEVGAGGLGCHLHRRPGCILPWVACWLPAWLGPHAVWSPNEPGLPGEPGALSWETVRIVCLPTWLNGLPLRWSELGCRGQSIGVSREQPSARSSGPPAGLPPSASLLTMGSGAGCQAQLCRSRGRCRLWAHALLPKLGDLAWGPILWEEGRLSFSSHTDILDLPLFLIHPPAEGAFSQFAQSL